MKKKNLFIQILALAVLLNIALVLCQSYKHEIGDLLGYGRCPACNVSFWVNAEQKFLVEEGDGKYFTRSFGGIQDIFIPPPCQYEMSFCKDCFSRPGLLKETLKAKGWHPAKIRAILEGIVNKYLKDLEKNSALNNLV